MAIPRNNLGVSVAEEGRHEEAFEHYRDAIRIEPGYGKAFSGIAARCPV